MSVHNTILNEKFLPEANAERIILHWTGGRDVASSDDRQHYHIIINQDGRIVFGLNRIDSNDNTADGHYAAHTRMCNSHCIGVALSGMYGATDKSFGEWPIKHAQYEIGCRVIAELCVRYRIDITRETVLNHGEVQENLGILQYGKWDVMVLPWNQSWNYQQVSSHFRERVSYYWRELMGLQQSPGQWFEKSQHPPKTHIFDVDRHTFVVTAKSGLNVRQIGSSDGIKIGVLQNGSQISVLSTPNNNGYVRIAYHGNYDAWVHKDYLKLAIDEALG